MLKTEGIYILEELLQGSRKLAELRLTLMGRTGSDKMAFVAEEILKGGLEGVVPLPFFFSYSCLLCREDII